jgi:hypothetical protein
MDYNRMFGEDEIASIINEGSGPYAAQDEIAYDGSQYLSLDDHQMPHQDIPRAEVYIVMSMINMCCN